ncbi:SCO6880 family protein [Rothia mucilaginosa]|uniref:SCO6880 family protein n=1 Tax=Rothia mucilaginosa TaxID=43675 RepID=UPI0026F30E0E|nr:SCO6880 family protein [Rothia mucilaginosa]
MKAPLYGNPLRSGSIRLGGWFPVRAGVILVVTALVVLICFQTKEFILGLLIAVGVTLYVGVFEVPFGAEDITLMTRARRRFTHLQRVDSGETLFLGSTFTAQNKGLTLPGVLSTLKVRDEVDGLGNPVQLIHHTRADQLSVTIESAPAGISMNTQTKTTDLVTNYASWLSSLSGENGLRGAQVVIDSVFESSAPLAESILSNLKPDAPAVAQQIARESAGMLPERVATVRAYTVLGYKISELADDVDGAAAEVLSMIPRHLKALSAAGAGVSQVMADADYADMLYTAYDPRRNAEVAQEIKDEILAYRSFEGAGPAYFNSSHPRVVLHDGVASMTIMMTEPSKSKITDHSFEKLFAPNRNFLRKRVSLIYRPVPASAQHSRVNNASRATTTEVSSKKRRTAFDKKKKAAAEAAMNQAAEGAVIQEWALMVTVTFEPTRAAQRTAENELKALMGGMKWCFADFSADAAFHQTLPLGLFPWAYAPALSLLAVEPSEKKNPDQKKKEEEN